MTKLYDGELWQTIFTMVNQSLRQFPIIKLGLYMEFSIRRFDELPDSPFMSRCPSNTTTRRRPTA